MKLPVLSSPTPREGELTAVLDREVFDALPGGVPETERPRWSAYRAAYNAAHRFDAPDAFPLQVDFELNSTCQMKCAFCVHGQGVVPKRELAFETFARAIDEGERYGLCSIKLNYINEPLLRRDLPRFIAYAREHGVLNVYFASNGLLLSRERAKELIEAGLSKILVSLDATTPETFLKMRRSTKLAEIEENIRGLLSLRAELGVSWPAVRVNFLRTAENAHEAEAFVARWRGVADSIGFQTQVQVPGVQSGVMQRPDPEPFRCSFPAKLLVVDSGGDILPCCTFNGREMPLGNLSTLSLADAWRSPARRALMALHAAGRGAENPVCAHCIGSGAA